MKIKIIEAGWAGYTGHFGMIAFEDGVSVDEVSRADAAYLAGLVAIETLEGVNPSSTQALLDAHVNPAPVVPAPVHIPDAPVVARVYTAEELAEVADQHGIRGIRAIAEPLGLKDNSIAELMAKILNHQEAAAKAAGAAA
jgi:hypothetical protein